MSWICKECKTAIRKTDIRWEHETGHNSHHIIIPVRVGPDKKSYSVDELIALRNEFQPSNFSRPDIIDFLTWIAEREKNGQV